MFQKGPDSDIQMSFDHIGVREVISCRACILHGGMLVSFDSHDGAMKHINEHIESGHKVPIDPLNAFKDKLEAIRQLKRERMVRKMMHP